MFYVALLDTSASTSPRAALGLVLLLAAGAMRDGALHDRRLHAVRHLRRRWPRAPALVGRLLATASAAADVSWMRIATLIDDAPPLQLVAAAEARRDAPRRRAAPSRCGRSSVRGLTCLHPDSGRGVATSTST